MKAIPLSRGFLKSEPKATIYNCILIFLGFAGVFIAGVLSLAKAMHVIVPCGGAKGCEVVTNHPSSIWFGVPVAYIGLLAYLALSALALARAFGPRHLFRPLVLLGFVFSVGGALISIGLQFYSFFVIHEWCKWCISSAIDMTATLIVYSLLLQEVQERPETLTAIKSESSFLVSSVLAVVLVLGLAYEGFALKNADAVPGVNLNQLPKDYSLIPANPNRYGDPNAPITIIEFADLNCPSCQQNSPLIKEFVREHTGRVQLIYRHFPIPTHKTSQLAAAIDEYAAEKGKFWDYTMAVMGTHKEVEDPAELFTIAESLGLNANDIKKRLANDNDPIYTRLTDDQSAANLIGVSVTPTLVVMAPGIEPKAFGGSQVRDALQGAPYDKFLNAK